MNMKRWSLVLGALLAVGGSAAWLRAKTSLKMPTPQRLQAAFPGDARQVFEDSQQFMLLSLDPSDIGNYRGKNSFHGYRIMGQTQVSPRDKSRLITALYNGIAENQDMVATCFSPHHGIHAVLGTEYVDLVICFSCLQVAIYSNTKQSGTLVSKSPQPTFDSVLKGAGVPLSPH